jgi:hypothetical protein
MRLLCLRALVVVLLLLPLGGCAYMRVQRPLDDNFQETRLGSKVGKSYAYSILWLVAWGDAGTKAAADNGGISVIQHADSEVLLWLGGAYTRIATIVYGD